MVFLKIELYDKKNLKNEYNYIIKNLIFIYFPKIFQCIILLVFYMLSNHLGIMSIYLFI